MTERPFGITILGILAFVNGLVGLCVPLLLLAGGGLAATVGGLLGTGAAAALVCIGGVAYFFGPFISFLVAYGAMNLRPWAWWLGLLGSGLQVIGVIINILNGIPIGQAVWSAILPTLIFIYLLTPNVRYAFYIGDE